MKNRLFWAVGSVLFVLVSVNCSNKMSEEQKAAKQEASYAVTQNAANTCYPNIDRNDMNKAIVQAAEHAKATHANLFVEQNERANAYVVMTTAINTLRANGWNAARTVAHPSLPLSDPYHFSSDALTLKGTIYDIYQSFPIPGIPGANPVGPENGRSEVTSDLVAVGQNCGQPAPTPMPTPAPTPAPSGGGKTVKAGDLILRTNERLLIDGFHLEMQSDGNLVIYRTGSVPVWASNTNKDPNWCANQCEMAFQGDGNLVLYRAGVAYWASNTNGANDHSKTLSFVGQVPYLTIRSGAGAILWQSR